MVNGFMLIIENFFGQLEIINGGWVQPDEAATHYIDLIDLYTLGLTTMNETFGECAQPKTAWQVDPFGHSREHANLMAMMGYDSLWFAREHYLEHQRRLKNKSIQMIWKTSDDNTNSIFTGVLNGDNLYGSPLGFYFSIRHNDDPIQDNPNLENYNLDERLATLVNYFKNLSQTQLHNHFIILMGGDFNYIDANMYFVNIDKLIKHLNQNYSSMLTAFYSTPTCYAQAVKNLTHIQWPTKNDDFFPYASSEHAYWSGYFTSKPAMKGFVRKSSALLQLTRQLQALALTSWTSGIAKQIEVLERAIALSQHHDAITGTSKEYVTQNYNYRMSNGWTAAEQVLANAMGTISQHLKPNNNQAFPTQILCRTINESECEFTKTHSNYIVTVYNSNSQPLSTIVRIPLYQNTNGFNLIDSNGIPVDYQITNVFSNPGQLNNTNASNFEISFMANVGPVGFATYFVSILTSTKSFKAKKTKISSNSNKNGLLNRWISNGLIQLDFDDMGYVSTFGDLQLAKNYSLKQEFLYYYGHDNANRSQASGAYIFRPQEETPQHFLGPINLEIINGPLMMEARQIVSPWVSQVIRLIPNKAFVEFEWTIGPLPTDYNLSKEVISRYTISGLQTNSTFWTDGNGRQLIKRIRNFNPNYNYTNTELVAANYFPIDSRIIISDNGTSLAILTDRAQGGGSLSDGQIEIMLHRRDFYDDNFGVAEALNEPGRDGRGLVVRGKHWLVLGNSDDVTIRHRTLAYELFHAPVLTFSNYSPNVDYQHNFVAQFSGLQSLPKNINLVTLKQLDTNNILIRLEHIFQNNESFSFAQPVTIDLTTLLSNFNISYIQELNLASNKILNAHAQANVTLNPMDIKTFQVTVYSISGTTTSTTIPTTTATTATVTTSTAFSNNTLNLLTILIIILFVIILL